MSYKLRGLMIGALMALASPALAGTISLKTGEDGGSLIAQGAVDSDWEISVQGAAFTNAVRSYDAQICCGMETVASSAAWITDPSVVAGSTSTGWGVGISATLRTTFDLTGADLSTAELTGTWRFADNTLGIFLNGNLIPGTDLGGTSTWASDFTLGSVTTGFVAGTNTLTFVGDSINSTWDGLWFDGQVTYAAVPLPASLPLMLAGLGALYGVARRRKSRS